jgi:hypothetical protein
VKVRIKGDISGSRNGVPWPKRGETMELPDDEGTALCASGLAVPAADTDDEVETAVPDGVDVETRSPGLTKAAVGAVTPDGSDDQEPAGVQVAADSKGQAPAPVKKTAAKRTTAKAQPEGK